jgi:hypothetical protein
MTGLVLIPENYYELTEFGAQQVIPICISVYDRYGQPIARRWFSEGVAPARGQLVRIAHHTLGDPWSVSELAEATVHRLWARYGSAFGDYPSRRVLKKAMWLAKELKVTDWRRRKYPKLYLALDALDNKIRDQTLADPNEYAELFEHQILLNRIGDRLQKEGNRELCLAYQLLRCGYTWDEVAKHVGCSSSEQVNRRFYRWIKEDSKYLGSPGP